MIRGVDVGVSYASDENGYVELTPEAANNPWAVIGEKHTHTHTLNILHLSLYCLQLLTEVRKKGECLT